MNIPVPARSRRLSLRFAAGLTLATGTVVGLLPLSASAAAVVAPQNVTATAPTPTSLSAQWDAGSGGAEATYYRIIVDNTTTPASDAVSLFAASSDRAVTGITATASTSYTITVCSNDEVTEACAPAIALSTPAPPPTTTVPATPAGTGPWRPFFTIDAFIRQNYKDFLGRAPKVDEFNFWRESLGTGAMSREGFLDELRNEPAVDPAAAGIVRLYTAYFLRRPEFGGYEYWRAQRLDGRSLPQISDAFAGSSEFKNRYGALDNAEFTSLVYRNVLGRNPDAGGFAYWTRQLDAGRTRGWMMVRFSESMEFQRKTDVVVAATEIYADMLGRVPTTSEYNDYTTMMSGNLDPGLDAGELLMIFNNVQYSNEYLARVTTR